MDRRLCDIYYSPKRYWKGFSAIKRIARAAGVSDAVAGSWLKKQAIWQIYLPPPHFIPRPMFAEKRPNAVNQCDLLCMPCVGRKTYRYCFMTFRRWL